MLKKRSSGTRKAEPRVRLPSERGPVQAKGERSAKACGWLLVGLLKLICFTFIPCHFCVAKHLKHEDRSLLEFFFC